MLVSILHVLLHITFATPSLDTASPDDSNEISFIKGEILDIIEKQGKWWEMRKADGTIGSTSTPPSLFVSYLELFSKFSRTIQLLADYFDRWPDRWQRTPERAVWRW
jgi:hypothetical protein